MDTLKHLSEYERLAAIAVAMRRELMLDALAEPAIIMGHRVRWAWLGARLAIIKARLLVGDGSDELADEAACFSDAYVDFVEAYVGVTGPS